MARVVVYHGSYGCDTGCCGHYLELDDEEVFDSFRFDHPNLGESHVNFAKRIIEEEYGKDHCHDLDWENCKIDDW